MAEKRDTKDWAKEHVRGMLLGATTPFSEDLTKIDETGLRRNLRHFAQLRADGIGWGGPLAEPFALSIAERKRCHEILAEEAKEAKLFSYAYPVSDSIPVALELAKHAADVGCDLLMVNVPFEWAKTDRMILEYFRLVSEAASGAGIMIYDTPHSGYLMPLDLMSALADLPNVCCMKGSTFDQSLQLMDLIGDRVVLSAGSPDDSWVRWAKEGFVLMTPTSASYMLQTAEWQPLADVYRLCAHGQFSEAEELSKTIQPLRESWRHVYRSFFDARPGHEEHPVAAIKHWIEQIGMSGGPVRPPNASLSLSEITWLNQTIEIHEENGLLRTH